jgi:hypothetical protein
MGGVWQGIPPAPAGTRKRIEGNLFGFLGKGLEGRISLDFLPLNTEIIAPKQQDVVHGA